MNDVDQAAGDLVEYCERCGGYRVWIHDCEPRSTLEPFGTPHPCDFGRCVDPAAHAEGAHDL